MKDFAWAALMSALIGVTAHFLSVEVALAAFCFTVWLHIYQGETKEQRDGLAKRYPHKASE